MKDGFDWRVGGNRVHIEITPELAKALNEIIWDVVGAHPDTGLGR